MQVRLKGINTVHKRLADGTVKTFYYHRSTGHRLEGKLGSPEFMASITVAEQLRKQLPDGIFKGIINKFLTSTDFTKLAAKTQKDYLRYLSMI